MILIIKIFERISGWMQFLWRLFCDLRNEPHTSTVVVETSQLCQKLKSVQDK